MLYIVYVVRVFEGAAGSWRGRGRGPIRHLLGEGVRGRFPARARVAFTCGFFLLVRGSLRMSAVSVGSLASIGGEVPVRVVAAATSSSVLSIFFCVRARTAAQARYSRTLLLCRIPTVVRIPSEMAGAYYSTFSCMFSVMR